MHQVTLWLCLVAGSAVAQSSGIADVDSARVARAAWDAAGRALRANDAVTARREMEHAASAWPTQQAYVWGRAVIAARMGDSAAVRSALAVGDRTTTSPGRSASASTAGSSGQSAALGPLARSGASVAPLVGQALSLLGLGLLARRSGRRRS